jgi:predicted metal-dependent enzyme (double-stranded beta helix superfamily)
MPDPRLDQWRTEVEETLLRHQEQLPAGLSDLCDELRHLSASTDTHRALIKRAEQARDSYQRWLVAEGRGFSVILIGWPPGFSTPIHDHDGLWGIELVLCGALHIDEYELEVDGPREIRTLDLQENAAAIFEDQAYAHACSNRSSDTPALSLHIYGGPLLAYSIYRPRTGDRAANPQRTRTATQPL